MIAYYCLYIWSVLSSVGTFVVKGGGYRSLYVILNIIPMILLLGLRSVYTGADSIAYATIFYYVGSYSDSSFDDIGMEYGYILYNKLINYIFNDVQFLFIISALITIGILGWFVFKESRDVYLPFILFNGLGYYTSNVNTMRQCMSASFLMIAMHFLLNGNRIKFAVFVLLASSIHTAALLFLPLLLIYPLNFKKVLMVICACVMMGLMLYKGGLLAFVGIMPEKYLLYIGSIHDVQGNTVGSVVKGIFYISLSFIGMFMGLKKREFDFRTRQKYLWISLLVFLAGVILVLQQYASVVGRMGYNYGIFVCILIPLIYEKMGTYFKSITIPIFIILLTIQFINMIDNLPADRLYEFM